MARQQYNNRSVNGYSSRYFRGRNRKQFDKKPKSISEVMNRVALETVISLLPTGYYSSWQDFGAHKHPYLLIEHNHRSCRITARCEGEGVLFRVVSSMITPSFSIDEVKIWLSALDFSDLVLDAIGSLSNKFEVAMADREEKIRKLKYRS